MKTDRTVTRPIAARPEPMKPRTVRAGVEWDDAALVAEAEGFVLAEVVRHYLREYVAGSSPATKRKIELARLAQGA